MSRPVILDAYSGAGGCSVGYHRAGWAPFGIDIKPMPNYPFPFHQGDAIAALKLLIAGGSLPFTHPGGEVEHLAWDDLSAAHASPTCQTFAPVTNWRGSQDDHPDLLTPTLDLLEATSLPWIVENVPEAPVRRDYLLCGTQFGLTIKRHRAFQRGNWTNYSLLPPCHCEGNPAILPFEHKRERAFADAMGCDWMTNREGRQAIPPAYTEYIGGPAARRPGGGRMTPDMTKPRTGRGSGHFATYCRNASTTTAVTVSPRSLALAMAASHTSSGIRRDLGIVLATSAPDEEVEPAVRHVLGTRDGHPQVGGRGDAGPGGQVPDVVAHACGDLSVRQGPVGARGLDRLAGAAEGREVHGVLRSSVCIYSLHHVDTAVKSGQVAA